LLGASHTVEEMRAFIGVTSLAFLSVEGLYRAAGYAGREAHRPQFTDHCFTGDYPTPLTDEGIRSNVKQLSLLAEAG
jgi:amidophosphoribosyltransferase